jgi:translocation and assembly module TamB
VKIFKRIVLSIVLLLTLVSSGVYILLGTAAGLSWLVRQIDAQLPGRLEIGTIEGGLFGQLHLQQVSYRDPDMHFAATDIMVRWTPMELLQRRLHIADITLLSPRYTLLDNAEPKPVETTASAPWSPQDIHLPFGLRLDKLEIRQLEIFTAADAQPIELHHALLTAAWDNAGIQMESAQFSLPGIDLSTRGTLSPLGQYPLDLHIEWALNMADMPKINAQGRVHGDLRQLIIAQQLSGDLQATLAATLENPLEQIQWHADVDLQHLSLQTLAADISGVVGATLSASGNLQRATTQGRVHLAQAADWFTPWQAELAVDADWETMRLAVQHLRLTRPTSPLALELSGNADADLNLDLKGHWNAFQWPLEGTAEVRSDSGEITLTGTPDAYQLALSADLAGTDIPAGQWQLSGHGDRQQLRLETLRGNTLDGTLMAQGRIAWAPTLSWDATLSTSGIDPAQHYPQWPGKLDLALSSKGRIDAQQNAEINLHIDKLRGELRGRMIAGNGQIDILGTEIKLQQIVLRSASAAVHADGNLGSRSDLVWRIDIADLADVLPEARGSLQGQGTLNGALEQPTVGGSLSAHGVVWEDLRLETLNADLQLDMSDKTPSHLELSSHNIHLGAEHIPALRISANGRISEHRLEAKLQHALANLALRLNGAYEPATVAWRGALDALDMQSADFGDWQLQQPAQISAAANAARLSPLCLLRAPGKLCAQGQWRPHGGQAQLQAENLPLHWLRGLLPPQIERLEGAVALDAQATLSDSLLAQANLTLSPGTLVIHPQAQESLTLAHQGGMLSAKLDQRQLVGDLQLAIGDDGLNGRFQVPRPALDENPLSAPLQGELHLQFEQLHRFAGLIPLVQELDGTLSSDLQLGGVLGQPNVKGATEVRIARIYIPDLGLELRELAVNARSADGQHIRLDGGVTSGNGRLELGGDIALDAEKNWPAIITLKGQEFQALNLPEMNARISTDLAFIHDADTMILKGSLKIPQAYIVLEDIPEGATEASSDVVIVGSGDADEQSPIAKGTPFAVQTTLILGNDVQFRGFGLKAYFEGKLTLDQRPGEFPSGSGELQIKEGTYKAYGQNLVIEQGVIAYSGGRIDNPGLSIRASRQATVELAEGSSNVVVGVNVSGSAKKPKLSVFSDPAMEERDAISVLLTGNIASNLGKSGGSIGIGKQLTKDLSVGAKLDREGSQTEFVTKYRFNRKLHLEATTSSKSNAADVFYSIQFD